MANQKLSNPENHNPVEPVPGIASAPEDIKLWREQLVRRILQVLAGVGLLALVAGAYNIYEEGNVSQLPIIFVAFASIAFLAFWPKSPYNLQAGAVLFVFYAVGGLSDMLNYGLGGDSVIFLLTGCVLALIFFGRRIGIMAFVVAVLTLAVFGWAYSTGRLVLPADTLVQRNAEAVPWTAHTFLFLAMGGLLVVAQSYLFDHLAHALTRSRRLAQQLEISRANLEQRVAERTAALERSSNYLVALQDTTVNLVGHREVNELLQAIVERAGNLVGTEHGYVFLPDPETGAMKMRVGLGAYSSLVGTEATLGLGLAGKVWQNGEALAVEDYQNWSDRLPGPERSTFRSVAGVPLKSAGSMTQARSEPATRSQTLVGIIGLAYVDPERKFGAAELDVLNRFAQLASIALENARLYERQAALAAENQKLLEQAQKASEENRQLFEQAQKASEENRQLFEQARASAEELNALTRHLTGEGWKEYLQRQPGAVFLQDADLNLDNATPLPVLQEAVEHRTLVTAQDDSRLAMALPITVRGATIGAIAVQDDKSQRAWTPEEVETLKDIAEHVSLALDNARLFEQAQAALAATQRRAEREAELARVNDRLHATMDVKGLLRIAAKELRHTTGGARAVIRLNRPGEKDPAMFANPGKQPTQS